jgi:hypothetical protein
MKPIPSPDRKSASFYPVVKSALAILREDRLTGSHQGGIAAARDEQATRAAKGMAVLGAAYIAKGEALERLPSSGGRTTNHPPAFGGTSFLRFPGDLLKVTAIAVFPCMELLKMQKRLGRNEDILPAGTGVRQWSLEKPDEENI